MSHDFVEIPDKLVRPGGTVTLPRGSFDARLRLGERMRFQRVVEGRLEVLDGMVVDLDGEIVEIDVPYEQPRWR